MRKVLFAFLLAMVSFPIWADDIILIPEDHDDVPKGQHMPPLLPTCSYDDYEFTIGYRFTLEDVSVTIRDDQDNVLFTSTIDYLSGSYSFYVTEYVAENMSTIEVSYGSMHLIGDL